jgi:hypothetical protein
MSTRLEVAPMEIFNALSIFVFWSFRLAPARQLSSTVRSDQTSLRLNFFLVKLEAGKFFARANPGTIARMVNYCLSVSNFVPRLDFGQKKVVSI